MRKLFSSWKEVLVKLLFGHSFSKVLNTQLTLNIPVTQSGKQETLVILVWNLKHKCSQLLYLLRKEMSSSNPVNSLWSDRHCQHSIKKVIQVVKSRQWTFRVTSSFGNLCLLVIGISKSSCWHIFSTQNLTKWVKYLQKWNSELYLKIFLVCKT